MHRNIHQQIRDIEVKLFQIDKDVFIQICDNGRALLILKKEKFLRNSTV